MRLSRVLFKESFWRQRIFANRKQFDKWFLESKWGFGIRIALLTAPVVIYSIGTVLINGPIINKTFKWRYNVKEEMPEHLKKLIEQEYENFLDRKQRKRVDTVVEFLLQDKYADTDSIVKGTLSSRAGGARIALPFFTQFKTHDEAMEYCKKNLEPLNLFKKVGCIIWESTLGQEIIDTFVLSDEAKRFIIYRDLMSCENYQALINGPVVVACYTAFSSILVYILNKVLFKKNPTALKFFVMYILFTSVAYFSAIEYHKLHYYMSGYHADEQTSLQSVELTNGGMEYYRKMLRRHRLLRELLEGGHDLFTPAGNLNGVPLNYIFRYGKLKEMTHENDEVAPAFEGDDF